MNSFINLSEEITPSILEPNLLSDWLYETDDSLVAERAVNGCYELVEC